MSKAPLTLTTRMVKVRVTDEDNKTCATFRMDYHAAMIFKLSYMLNHLDDSRDVLIEEEL